MAWNYVNLGWILICHLYETHTQPSKLKGGRASETNLSRLEATGFALFQFREFLNLKSNWGAMSIAEYSRKWQQGPTRTECLFYARRLHELVHLILTVTLGMEFYYFPDCMNEKTEAELVNGRGRIRFQEAWPRSCVFHRTLSLLLVIRTNIP